MDRSQLRRIWAIALLALVPCCRAGDPTEPIGPTHTLIFAGDTLLGRRLNECVDEHGLDRPLARLRGELESADVTLVNLEGILSSRGRVMNDRTGEMHKIGRNHFRGRPELVRILAGAGIDVVAMANNHAFDYGPDALADGIRILNDAGIQHVGAGADLDRATAPAFRRVGDTVVAIIAAHTTHTGRAAGAHSPGPHYLSIRDQDAFVAAVRAQVARARTRADVVMIAIHWGKNGAVEPTGAMRRIASRLVREAEVDAILGSHAHALAGVEVIDGRPVIYDAGNLLIDFSGEEFLAGEESRSALFELRFDRHGVRRIEALPLRVDTCTSYPAEGALRAEILDTIVRRSSALGTAVAVAGGRAVVRLEPEGARPAPPEHYENPPPAAPKLPEPGAYGSSAVVPRPPENMTAVGAVFDRGIELLGYVASGKATAGSWKYVALYWRATRKVGGAFGTAVLVRVPGSAGVEGWGGGFRPAGDWVYPTNRWEPGQIIVDEFVLRIPANAVAGRYPILAGLKGKGGALAVVAPGAAAVEGDLVAFGEFEIAGSAAAAGKDDD